MILTPVVVWIGFVWGPYITDFTDSALVAEEIAVDKMRQCPLLVCLRSIVQLPRIFVPRGSIPNVGT